jgi:hypothetical protein
MNKGGLHAECSIVNPKQGLSKYFLLSEGDVRPEVAAPLPLWWPFSVSMYPATVPAGRNFGEK